MNRPITFALNHMVAPRRSCSAFLDLAGELGIGAVEIRNDLAGVAIADGTAAGDVRRLAGERGISILTINALQRFNDWNAARASEARDLIAYARDCGARGLVLCPVNDTAFQPGAEARLAGLREALAALKPMLEEAGLMGLVEPLGFVECSLRSKREAVEAIRAVDGTATFRLVHDTFHHHLAGEPELFPQATGLVHVSGVVDPVVPVSGMRDPHRVLVDRADRLDSAGQVAALVAAGYAGPVSFEPFASSVHAAPDIAADLRKSMAFVAERLRPAA